MRAASSHIPDSLVRIEVRRFRRARLGLDPSGPSPNFRLTLLHVLEGSRRLALERLGRRRKREPSLGELLDELLKFGESFRKPHQPKKARLIWASP